MATARSTRGVDAALSLLQLDLVARSLVGDSKPYDAPYRLEPVSPANLFALRISSTGVAHGCFKDSQTPASHSRGDFGLKAKSLLYEFGCDFIKDFAAKDFVARLHIAEIQVCETI